MENVKTVFYKSTARRQASLLIIDKNRKPRIVVLNGSKTVGRNYPTADCDILLDSSIVSRRHGEFVYDETDKSFFYVDKNSTNGTYINGNKLESAGESGSIPCRLNDGDIIRIDKKNLNNPYPEAVLMVFSRTFSPNEKWIAYNLNGKNNITIGRDEQNMLRLSDIMVSRQHAVLSSFGEKWFVYDQNSRNGVSVNGREIEGNSPVYDHDIIKIANTTMVLWGNTLLYNLVSGSDNSGGNLSVHIERKVAGKLTLLKDIDFDVQSGEFVLILGGSGAGKTTLVNAILGQKKNLNEKKPVGRVLLNGLDLYANFKMLKSQIGFVPQQLTLRGEDNVITTLYDQAYLKLGKDFSDEFIKKRVNEVMEKVGITEIKDREIKRASGGQQKRIAVAAELIGFPKVLICDEPDSGLDAANRRKLMEILKSIADEGQIVMLISHEPNDAQDLFTRVLTIAKSSVDNAGHLAYYGDVQGALDYFGIKSLQDIMIEINPPYEGGKGRADHYIEKYNNTLRRH